MAIIVILSLLTLIGLFSVYRILAWDNRSTSQVSPKKKSPSPLRIKLLGFQKAWGGFFSAFEKKKELKVEPIRSLKEYYAKEAEETPVEIDLTKEKIENFSVENAAKSSASPQPAYSEGTIKVPANFYAELKARFEQLRDSHRKLERLLLERTTSLEQTKLELDKELALHQDFKKIKSWLEQQIVDLRLELAEKDKQIDALQNPPSNRIAAQLSVPSVEPDLSRDFVKLPADLIAEGKAASSKDQTQGIQNKFFEAMEEQNTNLFYRMPSEEDIIKDLKNKKYSV